MNWLKGKKTYLVAAMGALGALAGVYFGALPNDRAVELLVLCAGLAGLRSGITSEIAKLLVTRAADEGKKRRGP